jgi:hypothetical protein
MFEEISLRALATTLQITGLPDDVIRLVLLPYLYPSVECTQCHRTDRALFHPSTGYLNPRWCSMACVRQHLDNVQTAPVPRSSSSSSSSFSSSSDSSEWRAPLHTRNELVTYLVSEEMLHFASRYFDTSDQHVLHMFGRVHDDYDNVLGSVDKMCKYTHSSNVQVRFFNRTPPYVREQYRVGFDCRCAELTFCTTPFCPRGIAGGDVDDLYCVACYQKSLQSENKRAYKQKQKARKREVEQHIETCTAKRYNSIGSNLEFDCKSRRFHSEFRRIDVYDATTDTKIDVASQALVGVCSTTGEIYTYFRQLYDWVYIHEGRQPGVAIK